MSVRVIHGDALEAMRALAAEGVTVHSVVTDPPYHLTSDDAVYDLRLTGAGNPRERRATRGGGFMGKKWDGGSVAFDPETWRVAFDLLPPGGHLLAFGGTRTYHRLACAIEDAGFEVRDQIGWLYGSGFNKNGYVSLALERTLCERRGEKVYYVGTDEEMRRTPPFRHRDADGVHGLAGSLKPAWEPIVVARKPLAGTVAENVLKHGTGALNIDGCRVPTDGERPLIERYNQYRPENFDLPSGSRHAGGTTAGRWPANVVHDGSDEVLEAFAAFGELRARGNCTAKWHDGKPRAIPVAPVGGYEHGWPGDTGTAARFFYAAKASKAERAGSKHPTVKPLTLMRWLVRLVTPPGGLVLDPFAGSGTTGEAAMLEGFNAILIEREEEYVSDARARLERARAAAPLLMAAE